MKHSLFLWHKMKNGEVRESDCAVSGADRVPAQAALHTSCRGWYFDIFLQTPWRQGWVWRKPLVSLRVNRTVREKEETQQRNESWKKNNHSHHHYMFYMNSYTCTLIIRIEWADLAQFTVTWAAVTIFLTNLTQDKMCVYQPQRISSEFDFLKSGSTHSETTVGEYPSRISSIDWE